MFQASKNWPAKINRPVKVRKAQKGKEKLKESSQGLSPFHKKPCKSPAGTKVKNIRYIPTTVSQKCHSFRVGEYQGFLTTLGHNSIIIPNIQKPKTPNMTRWAWPTTQSVKWIIS